VTPPAVQGVEVELGADTGWHGYAAVGVEADRLGEHEVAALRRPAGRVVGELEERSAADAGDHVQVGQQPDAVRPGEVTSAR